MFENDVDAANAFVKKIDLLKSEISKKVIGQNKVIDQILISVFCKGHALLVGVPGLAKTLMINTIAECMGLVGDLKIKKTYTEKELRKELEMKGKSNPWMNRIINYLFEW